MVRGGYVLGTGTVIGARAHSFDHLLRTRIPMSELMAS